MNAFPLLAKELTELAARRRTYLTRVVYALLLFGFFVALNEATLRRASLNPLSAMGSGMEMFKVLIVLQLAGICLFLPAFTAGLITQEKERDSLVLLFLTELSPWQILLQKLGSGLVSIFSFLLIGMPLAALCYAYGGISSDTLFQGVAVLFLTCLQVAAFALLCSTWARTTVVAFIGTYVGAGIFMGAVALAGWVSYYLLHGRESDRYIEPFMHVFAPALLDHGGATIPQTLLLSVAPLVTTLFFLLLARFYFVRRAFAPPRQRLLAAFRWIDAVMQRANRLLGNITFRSRDRALPQDDPIAWRELTRTTLGRPQYLVRVLLAVEIPTLALCFWAIMEAGTIRQNEALSALAAAVGTLSVLSLSALAANAFVSERVSQTLEVLLTTPLVARDIVRQKARMLTRFLWVLAVPLATIFAIEAWAEAGSTHWNRNGTYQLDTSRYLICSALTLAIYLPLVLWLSLWIGLKMRTRFRAILTALGVIVAWCVLPAIVVIILKLDSGKPESVLLMFTPLAVPALNEVDGLRELFPHWETAGLIVNFLFYGSLALLFRALCLRRADRYLRR